MPQRDSPVGFRRETWRPQPTSSWTPRQADPSKSQQNRAPSSSGAGPSSGSAFRPSPPPPPSRSPPSPRYRDSRSNQNDGPSRPDDADRGKRETFRTKIQIQRDREEELARRGERGGPGGGGGVGGDTWRPGGGGRNGPGSGPGPDDARRREDHWRPGDGDRGPGPGTGHGGRSGPRETWEDRNRGGRFNNGPSAGPSRTAWNDRRNPEPPRGRNDDWDRRGGPGPATAGGPGRVQQESYRPKRSPSPVRRNGRGRRDSPDYGLGRRATSREPDIDTRSRNRSLSRSSTPPSSAFARKRGPSSPRSGPLKRPRDYSPPPPSYRSRDSSPPPRRPYTRDISPAPSATSSRFRPSPSRSRSRGRYTVERSLSPRPRRTSRRSPSPLPRRTSVRGRSPSPRGRKTSGCYVDRYSPPPRRFRSPSPIPPSRRRSPSESPPPPPRTSNPVPQQEEIPFHAAPPPHNTNGTNHIVPAVQPGFPPINPELSPSAPVRIDLQSAAAATARRSVSPTKGGWKSISNGPMPNKTAVQRMFEDSTVSPPRGPRSSVSPSRANGKSPPSGPSAERSPPLPPLEGHAPMAGPPTGIAPYIETAFQQWASQGSQLPLRDFLVHYFGRPPDIREVSQMERLLEQSRARQTFQPPPQPFLNDRPPGNGANHWSPHQGSFVPRRPWGRSGSSSPVKESMENFNSVPLPGPSRYGIVPPPGPPAQVQTSPAISGHPEDAKDRSRDDVSVKSLPRDDPNSKSQSARRGGDLYERLTCVGEGTYGKVYKARNMDTGQFVALKRIRMEGEKDGFPVTAMREIKVLQSLHHPNVLHLIEMMVSKGSVYMVLEYMDHDLTGLLAHPEIVMSPANIKSLNHQMLSGLAYLHERGILHRDMKGSNILLSGKGELKLADFGLARTYSKRKRDDYTNRVITLWYRSPELLLGETVYGTEVDMWSAGCIMLEVFTSKPAFQGNDEISQLEVIYSVLGTPSEQDWPGLTELPWYELVKPKEELPSRFRETFSKWLSSEALELADKLLTFDPSKRISAVDALQTPYFTTEEPPMAMPTQLADCGEHHEMSAKIERHRRRQESK